MRQFYFEKLDVWQKGRLMIKQVYHASKDFPLEERFALTQQIRRACVFLSIRGPIEEMSNILNALRTTQLKR